MSEFISEVTGYPVTDVNNPDAYVSRIIEAMENDKEKRKKWDAAVDLLLSRHSTDYFTRQLNEIEDYFIDESIED